ncbi:MAG: sterol desaturase family protein [Pseudomonadota bacterium]
MTLGDISEPVLRFGVFAGVLIAMILLEFAVPKRALSQTRRKRWATNFAIVGIDTLAVRLLARTPEILSAVAVPLAAVGVALWAESAGIGLFNVFEVPFWLALLVSVLVLDFAIWLQHWLSHRIPILWRLHQVHHADPDIDVSTAIRFHPVEIMLSMIYKIAWVLVLGAPAVAVVVFEVLLNGCAMFNHANIALPRPIDRVLRWFIVTPDMHRVHHSTQRHEHDTNYGFSLSVWDRVFATYTDQPERGHQGMDIGLPEYRKGEPVRLSWSLLVPFQRLRRG